RRARAHASQSEPREPLGAERMGAGERDVPRRAAKPKRMQRADVERDAHRGRVAHARKRVDPKADVARERGPQGYKRVTTRRGLGARAWRLRVVGTSDVGEKHDRDRGPTALHGPRNMVPECTSGKASLHLRRDVWVLEQHLSKPHVLANDRLLQ